MAEEIYTLPNGRVYKVVDTGKPYVHGEYPEGGFAITTLLQNGNWLYIDNSPDKICVENFLKAAGRIMK